MSARGPVARLRLWFRSPVALTRDETAALLLVIGILLAGLLSRRLADRNGSPASTRPEEIHETRR